MIICADVIEHLLDPDELLRWLSSIPFKKIVFSTPDRSFLVNELRSSCEMGPPHNPHHVREWNFQEFERYIIQWFHIDQHIHSKREFWTQIIVCSPKKNKFIVHKTQKTLDTIKSIIEKKEKGIYLRFGDGDINLANGSSELHQNVTPQFQTEMREALALNGTNVLKALPLYCKELDGWENGMFPGNHECDLHWALNILNQSKKFWGTEITDVYSHVALHFAATNYPSDCINFLKFIKKSNCSMLIGNKDIPKKIRDLLFGTESIFVPTLPSQSYIQIDAIEKEVLEKLPKNDDYKIIVTAMGCAGRVLQKRLWKNLDNVFLFDFGSLMDALCGWNTRAWIELNNFNTEKFIQLLYDENK